MSSKSLFLSYSRDDAEVIGAITHDLRSFGHDVWMDEELTGGTAWWQHILERIRAADALVLGVSDASIGSEACQLEWQYAIDTNRCILPVMLASSPPLPPTLADYQFVSYRSDEKSAAIDLLRSVDALHARPLPDPLPTPPVVPGSYLRELYERVTTSTPLDLAAQLEIVFTIRERLEEGRDREQLVQHLRTLRSRDDLLAKVSRDVEGLLDRYDRRDNDAPTARRDRHTSRWSAEVKEFVDTSITPSLEIEIVLSSETHALRLQDGIMYVRLFVDGAEVAKSTDNDRDFEFELSDGAEERHGTLHYRMAWGGAGRLLDLSIVVDGVTLHELHR